MSQPAEQIRYYPIEESSSAVIFAISSMHNLQVVIGISDGVRWGLNDHILTEDKRMTLLTVQLQVLDHENIVFLLCHCKSIQYLNSKAFTPLPHRCRLIQELVWSKASRSTPSPNLGIKFTSSPQSI